MILLLFIIINVLIFSCRIMPDYTNVIKSNSSASEGDSRAKEPVVNTKHRVFNGSGDVLCDRQALWQAMRLIRLRA